MMFRSGTDRLENRTVARPREVRSAASRDRPERRRRALRLVVESLEDRTVLTTLLTVNSLLDDGTAGTLRAVIGQANSGNDSEYVIRFDPTVTGTITLTQGELALANSNAAVAAKSITIEGPGASQLAVSGNNASRVFEIMSGLSATLEGLTITGGQASRSSGIFNNRGGTLNVTNSTISRNSDRGIVNNEGTVTITNSTISGNSGGGISNNQGTVNVTDSTINGNSTDSNYDGGGIWNTGTLTVTDSIISRNSATNNGGGIFNSSRGVVTITGSNISSNSAIHFGGGIRNTGLLTVIDSTINSNAASIDGGGIYNLGTYKNSNGETVPATVTLINSILNGNGATDSGGGLYNRFGAMVTVTNSTISNNRSGNFAGGIYNHDATVTVATSTLSGNSANASGGGIFNNSGVNNIGRTVTVTNSTISDNSASTGGGIFNNSDGTVTVTNSTISGNSATRYGGGIYNDNGGTVTVTNSTLSGNSATRYGGGIFKNSIGTVTVTNAIVAENQSPSGPDLYGAVSSHGHNLIGDTTDSSGWLTSDLTGTAIVPLDPLLGPLQDNGGPTQTMALLPGSPALDAGTTVQGLTTDQRGIARPQGSAPDIGAFESRGFVLTIVGGGNQSAAVGRLFSRPLVVSVSNLFGEPVDGGIVRFTAPVNGPSTTPPVGTSTISQGKASDWIIANTQAGSYVVTASVSGASQSVTFRLTNLNGVPVPVLVTATGGTPQTTTIVSDFTLPLEVRVTDQYGNPVPGVAVTFAAPSNGAGALFGTAATFTATTDAAGLARATATANSVAGNYTVTASAAGVTTPTFFALTNTPGAPAQVTIQGDTSRIGAVATPFAQPLVVKVTDSYGNPVPGVAVTFAAPGNGPTASFDGVTTFTATTDGAGLATAHPVANTEAGQYGVTVAAAGVTPPVVFLLTNAPTNALRVVGLQRLGFQRLPTRLGLRFNEGLDPSRASAPQNYALFHAGRDGLLGTRDDRRLGLTRVVYDPVSSIVTLRPNRRLSLKRRYTLVVRGTPPDGLASPSGGFLAGAGQPGTDYVATFGREILIRPRLAKSSGSPAGPKAGSTSMVGRSRPSHHG